MHWGGSLCLLLALSFCGDGSQSQQKEHSAPQVIASPSPAADRLDECGIRDGEPTALRPGHAVLNVLSRVKPEYPAEVAKAGIEGNVDVAIRIGSDGQVVRVCATSGPEALWQPAEGAALRWTFKKRGEGRDLVDHIVFSFKVERPLPREPRANP